jgi:hypothetical protein
MAPRRAQCGYEPGSADEDGTCNLTRAKASGVDDSDHSSVSPDIRFASRAGAAA